MRTFAPLTDDDLPLPGVFLDALVDVMGSPGNWVVIGATARDFALQVGNADIPRRATKDIDLAVAATSPPDFQKTLDSIGAGSGAWQRRVLLGQQVDILPFGGIEQNGEVSVEDSILNALGLSEAAEHADLLQLPSGRVLPVAPLELIAILKLISFSDRFPAQSKDAVDLGTTLDAASLGTYGDEVWGDAVALDAAGFDHGLASAFRLGMRGIRCFSPDRANQVLSLVDKFNHDLRTAWKGEPQDVLDAWLRGLQQGISQP